MLAYILVWWSPVESLTALTSCVWMNSMWTQVEERLHIITQKLGLHPSLEN